MITQVILENFKSASKQSIDLAPITVIIGPNRSGKSSILQALGVLKGFVENASRPIDQLFNLHSINLGSYKNVVHKHKDELTMKIGVEISNEDIDLRFSLQLGPKSATLIRWKKPFKVEAHAPITLPWSPKPERTQFIYGNKKLTFVWDGLNTVIEPADPELSDFINIHKTEIQKMNILFSNRGFLKPIYQRQEASLPSTLSMTQDRIASLLDDVDFETTVMTWTEEVFGVRVEAKTVPPNIRLITRLRHFAPNIVNEGFGLNQATYMFAVLAAAKEGALIGIEEPEISLHPQAQTKLARIFQEVIKTMNKRILITTHSEHLLVGLLTLVANGELRPDQLGIWSMERKGYSSKAKKLKVNEKGQVEGGIPDFFEHELSTSMEYIKALAKGSSNESSSR